MRVLSKNAGLVFLAGELSGGLLAGLLTVVYAFSYAAIMFSGPVTHGFSAGLSMALITAAVAAIVVSALGNVRFAIAGPDIYSAVPLAVMIYSLASQLPDGGTRPQSVTTLVIAVSLTTFVTGAVCYGLGRLRLAKVIRYIPYPVIAGFLSATGLLIALAGTGIVTGIPVRPANFERLVEADTLIKLGVTLAFTLLIVLAGKRYKGVSTFPVLICVGIGAFYVGLSAFGLGPSDAQAAGWLFDLDSGSYTWKPWYFETQEPIVWSAYLAVIPEILAVCLITMLAVLINASSLELMVEKDCDLDQDLRAHGIASLVSAALGGFIGSLSMSRTSINLLAGGTGRLSGMVCGVFAAAVLLLGADVINSVPRFLLGAVMISLGLQFVWKWSFSMRRTMSLADYVMSLVIVLVVLTYGYAEGIGAGVVASALIFATRYSHVPAYSSISTLADRRSRVDRSLATSQQLTALGDKVAIVHLQGFLFFGSADKLQRKTSEMLPGAHSLVLDFQSVEGLDSSACYSLQKLLRMARWRGVQVVISSLSENVARGLTAGGIELPGRAAEVYESLDAALEACEERLLAAYQHEDGGTKSFGAWLVSFLRSDDAAIKLLHAMDRRELRVEERLCDQGAPADELYFVEQGRVGAFYESGTKDCTRVRSTGDRTILGEMGFFTSQPRTATLEAETPAVVHVLTRETYERLCGQYPQLSSLLLESALRVLIDRLDMNTKLISIYENSGRN